MPGNSAWANMANMPGNSSKIGMTGNRTGDDGKLGSDPGFNKGCSQTQSPPAKWDGHHRVPDKTGGTKPGGETNTPAKWRYPGGR